VSTEPAESLAASLFAGMRTALGGLEINHAHRVAARVGRYAGDRTIAVALLHDTVSSGRITFAELREVTGDPRLAELIEALTRATDESDEHYLARCAAEPTALLVKRAHLADRLIVDDSNVSADVALRIRRQAARQLALLNLLARRHHR
jgi:(p)ppGpp synthase/HD superfamily hydrolase